MPNEPFDIDDEIFATGEYPKRYYLAGPEPMYRQLVAMVPGRMLPIRSHHGIVIVRDAVEEDVVLHKVAMKVYPEDWPEDRAATPIGPMGYAPRSFGARDAHQALIDGRL